MGLGGISIWQLLIVLAIVILVFGTKRLKNIGGDVGGAIKSFKNAVNDDEKEGVDSVEAKEKTTASLSESKVEEKDKQ